MLGCLALLGGQVRIAANATSAIVVCDPGYNAGNSPIQGIPTYDYGTDGMVRFHFTLDGNGWAPSNNFVAVYGENCEYLYTKGYTYASSGSIPQGVIHLMVKAQEVTPGGGWYVFTAYDEDTNEPVGLGGMPTQVNEPFVSFAILQNPSYYVYNGAKSPAVPVRDPTRMISKTPVLIVPGVMGTELKMEGELLWVDLDRMLGDVGDQFMDKLQFKEDLQPENESVSPDQVIAQKPLFDYTGSLADEFKTQGYTENQDLFTFPYDWRYGVTGVVDTTTGKTTVDLLQQRIEEISQQTGSSQVDVIAHSTGGLLVKKYVMDHPDSHRIRKAVFVGVPNVGAPKAIKTLLMGDGFGIPWLADGEMLKLSQNLPVVYDLMPSAQYYSVHTSPINILSGKVFVSEMKNLSYDESISYLTEKGLNISAITQSQSLHSRSFDSYDMRTAGVDVYNIVGCKSGTVTQVLDYEHQDGSHIRYDVYEEGTGDGTVPLESSTYLPVNDDHKFYALKTEHAKMLSQDGVRQTIVNVVSGANLAVSDKAVTSDIGKCKLKGKAVAIYSPVDIQISDQFGNKLGLAEDGSIQNTIPGADFEIMGEHKYAFLPDEDGEVYSLNLKGTGTGLFTVKVDDIDGSVIGSKIFASLTVTPSLVGTLSLTGDTKMDLDTNNDGSVDQELTPSTLSNPSQSQDYLPPISTSTLSGIMGQAGFYRSEVVVALNATDTVVSGLEDQTSGVLDVRYALDDHSSNPSYSSYASPITVSTEGPHTLSFYSVDRAGNREAVQTINFTIDKTAPEVSLQFDQNAKDLVFSGIDNSPVSVSDKDDIITVTDQAGNATVMKLKDKNRKRSLKAEIKSISYNGQVADLSKNSMAFSWAYDRKDKDKLVLLSQIVTAKKDYLVSAIYNGKSTVLLGRDASGKIKKTLPGLTLLKIATSTGDLNWSY